MTQSDQINTPVRHTAGESAIYCALIWLAGESSLESLYCAAEKLEQTQSGEDHHELAALVLREFIEDRIPPRYREEWSS